ncbi:unnamed protein product [Polarella glacialis]|uniref:peptidylprolyl isomerase n=1 Tax=Polarella glacialis TaxID=89957 RepID=A0A813FL42_POLGL|nr:unnamed protein product [Polarella glacialis]
MAMAMTVRANSAPRRRSMLLSAGLAAGMAATALLVLTGLRARLPEAWLTPTPDGRRALLRNGVAAAGLTLLPQLPAFAADEKPLEIPPGYLPAGLFAKKVGEKVVTPNGLIYEALELGSSEEGPRFGPPKGQATVSVKFTAHTDSFDGPVFDSSQFRGSRRPNKVDFIECRLNVDATITNGLNEAIKLMKVGGKGQFVQPPELCYSAGKVAFESDELSSNVTGGVKIPAGSTLYYEVELVSIIKP